MSKALERSMACHACSAAVQCNAHHCQAPYGILHAATVACEHGGQVLQQGGVLHRGGPLASLRHSSFGSCDTSGLTPPSGCKRSSSKPEPDAEDPETSATTNTSMRLDASHVRQAQLRRVAQGWPLYGAKLLLVHLLLLLLVREQSAPRNRRVYLLK